MIDSLNPVPVAGCFLEKLLVMKWIVRLELKLTISCGIKFPLKIPILFVKMSSPSNMPTTSSLKRLWQVLKIFPVSYSTHIN